MHFALFDAAAANKSPGAIPPDRDIDPGASDRGVSAPTTPVLMVDGDVTAVRTMAL